MQILTSELIRILRETQRIIESVDSTHKNLLRAMRVQKVAVIELQARLDAIEVDETTLILDTNGRKAS